MCIFLLLPNIALAWDFTECQVVEIILGDDDRNAHARLSCEIVNIPTCAITANSYFAFDRSTESGKQKLVMVMSAHATNMKVTGTIVRAENSCPTWQGNVALLASLRTKW